MKEPYGRKCVKAMKRETKPKSLGYKKPKLEKEKLGLNTDRYVHSINETARRAWDGK